MGVGSYQIKYTNSVSIGNPISCGLYDPNNVMLEGGRYSWEGRNLTRFRHEELQTTLLDVNYAYDANGLRIQKKVGNIVHNYFYDGGNLVYEGVGSTSFRFAYDENGLLSTLTYTNGTTSNRYFYVRDILLNIIGLKDVLGNLVVRYNYDAWGNILSVTGSEASTVGQANPFRYKGYYYDSETMMYYCQSRYYVPEWCRWLNADDPSYLADDSPTGVNLFAYCGNNPVNSFDPSGTIVITLTLAIILTLVAIGATAGGIFAYKYAYSAGYRGWELAGLTALGVIGGGAVGGAIGCFVAPAIVGLLGSGGAFALVGGGTIGGSTLMIASTSIAISGAITIAGVASLMGVAYMFAKTLRQSGKATASNKPSWVTSDMINPELSAQQNATNILNAKYGQGNWSRGPGSEYSQIVKWIERYVWFYGGR